MFRFLLPCANGNSSIAFQVDSSSLFYQTIAYCLLIKGLNRWNVIWNTKKVMYFVCSIVIISTFFYSTCRYVLISAKWLFFAFPFLPSLAVSLSFFLIYISSQIGKPEAHSTNFFFALRLISFILWYSIHLDMCTYWQWKYDYDIMSPSSLIYIF